MKTTSIELTRRAALTTLMKTGAGIGLAGVVSNTVGANAGGVNDMNNRTISCGPYTQRIDGYMQASNKALHWLEKQLKEDGSFGPDVKELTGYFKIAYLFCIAGRLENANRHVGRAYPRSSSRRKREIEQLSQQPDASHHQHKAGVLA